MTPLSSRLLVAAGGIPLLLAAAYAGGWFFRGLVALIALLSAREVYRILNPGAPAASAWPAFALAVSAPFLFGAGDSPGVGPILLGFLLLAGVTLLYPGARRGPCPAALLVLPLYPVLPLVAFVWLRNGFGWPAVYFLFALLWVGDTAAYAGGRFTGRHALAPQVSPRKTWEGAGWALAFSLAVAWGAWALGWTAPLDLPWALGAGALVWGTGMLGDLFESLLKRRAGVKDSSALLGAHGGVLDRFDSLLFAAPALYWLLLRAS